MCQFGFPDDTQFVIDTRNLELKSVLRYLESNKWKKLFFNGKFEGTFFYHYFDTPINNVFDAQVVERIINPSSLGDVSLEDVVMKYCDVKLDKETRKSFYGGQAGPFTEKQINYGADDVKYLFSIYEQQSAVLKEKQSEHIADLENALVTVVALMEVVGVPVDANKWKEILKDYIIEHEESRQRLLAILLDKPEEDFQPVGTQQTLFGGEETTLLPTSLNLNSPAQLKVAFKRLGIDLKSTDNQVISLIRHPAAEELVKYRELQKLISSYGQESFLDKIHPFTGRIHPNWRQLGAETGRFSCRAPNMQQIPEKLRKAIGGEKDWVLLGADFSQMELRILAQESKDPVLVEAFTTGKDIHTTTATVMFDTPAEKVTKEQRYAAKTLNFGITYGMQVKKFTDMMNAEAKKEGKKPITIAQASNLMDKYRATYRVANRYLDSIGQFALTQGYVETRFGRKRWFHPVDTRLDPRKYAAQIASIKRAGANMPIQGTNADITKMAMIDIHNELRSYGFKASIILQVHDEIVLLVHKSQVESIKPIIVNAMINAGKTLLPDIPVIVEPYVSNYWPK